MYSLINLINVFFNCVFNIAVGNHPVMHDQLERTTNSLQNIPVPDKTPFTIRRIQVWDRDCYIILLFLFISDSNFLVFSVGVLFYFS